MKVIKAFFFLLTVITLIYLAYTDPVYASGDCKGQSCNNGGDTAVDVSTNITGTVNNSMSGGDTSVSTGGTLALSNSLGDVDIAGCLGSTQWNSPVFGKQKLVLNQVCMAEFYLNAGKYALAAQSLCNVPEILREFSNEAECEEAHDFNPVVTAAPVVLVEDYYEEQMLEQQMAYEVLEQKVSLLEEKPRTITRVVQQPFLTSEKRQALEALRNDDGME